MDLIVFVIFSLFILIVVSTFAWPVKMLWSLSKFIHRQAYRASYYHTDYVNDIDEKLGLIVLSSEVNVFTVTLIRRITKLPIHVISDDTLVGKSQILKMLFKRCHITVSSSKEIAKWHKKNVLMVHKKAYESVVEHYNDIDIVPLVVCGFDHARHHMGQSMAKWIHLSFFPSVDTTAPLQTLQAEFANYVVYAWERYIGHFPSISELFIRQMKSREDQMMLVDSTGVELTGHKLLTATIAVSKKLTSLLINEQRVGICLPPSAGGSMAMMALLMQGKTIVNLNYTASPEALNASIEMANIKTIVTSGKFIEQLKKKGFYLEEVFAASKIILLEDVKQQIDKLDFLKILLKIKFFKASELIEDYVHRVSIDQTAVILFSSGSEGLPKGVELTHRNIIGNVKQAMVLLEATANDRLMSILPIFHAFGLTATTLLPMLEGLMMICHPDPTDTEVLGKLSEKYSPTFLCATSTFLRIYAKSKHLKPEMLNSYRAVVAGAEKLQLEVREMFEAKFNKPIFEGYGTTELSPVTSANQPPMLGEIRNRLGTVGKCVPGARFMIINPETLEELPLGEEGMITVGGVNVMKGYLNQPKKTQEVIFRRHKIRWYQTGDKGKLDEDGYLTIVDRYSRFAKIGGEMISLSVVEMQIKEILPLNDMEEILAVAVPDTKKGELIGLLYNFDKDPEIFKKLVKASSKINNLSKPAHYIHVVEMPKLGSGKTDYAKAKEVMLAALNR